MCAHVYYPVKLKKNNTDSS